MNTNADKSIALPLFGDGRFLIVFTGLTLIFSGIFVITQSLTGHFLPQDTNYLGMDAPTLSVYYSGRINKFMFHDRVAFGGSIIAAGCMYMWLSEFPIKNKKAWAWWLLLFSGIIGFGSFLTYLGNGYFDKWHGIATILLLPFFTGGLMKSWRYIDHTEKTKGIFKSVNKAGFGNSHEFGILLLQFVGFGLLAGGLTIMVVGMTTVFVPQDITFMQIADCGRLQGVNSKLIPLIAHDRACFGGGLATIGLMVFFIVRRTEETRSMWEILFIALNIGFISAISIHFYIGYTDSSHLAPAYFGYIAALSGLALTYKRFNKNINAAWL